MSLVLKSGFMALFPKIHERYGNFAGISEEEIWSSVNIQIYLISKNLALKVVRFYAEKMQKIPEIKTLNKKKSEKEFHFRKTNVLFSS